MESEICTGRVHNTIFKGAVEKDLSGEWNLYDIRVDFQAIPSGLWVIV